MAKIPRDEQKICIGGLMRCCIESLRTTEQNIDEPFFGQYIPCKYCKDEESGVYWDGESWRALMFRDRDEK